MDMIAHKGFFPLPEKRDALLKYVAGVLSFPAERFTPYAIDANSFVVDSGNNWLLSFKDGQEVSLRYRYQTKEGNAHEEALGAWLGTIGYLVPKESYDLHVVNDAPNPARPAPHNIRISATYAPKPGEGQ